MNVGCNLNRCSGLSITSMCDVKLHSLFVYLFLLDTWESGEGGGARGEGRARGAD